MVNSWSYPPGCEGVEDYDRPEAEELEREILDLTDSLYKSEMELRDERVRARFALGCFVVQTLAFAFYVFVTNFW